MWIHQVDTSPFSDMEYIICHATQTYGYLLHKCVLRLYSVMTGPLQKEPQCLPNIGSSTGIMCYHMKEKSRFRFLSQAASVIASKTYFPLKPQLFTILPAGDVHPISTHFLISFLLYQTENSAAYFIVADSKQARHDNTNWDSTNPSNAPLLRHFVGSDCSLSYGDFDRWLMLGRFLRSV